MREILFRGFSSNEHGTKTITVNGEKVRGDWVEGSVHIYEDSLIKKW